jgi:hypothetical protein
VRENLISRSVPPLVNFVAAVAATALKKAVEDAYRRVWESLDSGGGYSERQQIVKDPGLSEGCANDPRDDWVEMDGRERKAQEDIIRDIFGNPFRPDPTIDPSWLVRASGAIPRLTESIALLDLPSQALAVERHFGGWTEDEKLAWLSVHGRISPVPTAAPGLRRVYLSESVIGLRCCFFIADDMLVFFGDNTTYTVNR